MNNPTLKPLPPLPTDTELADLQAKAQAFLKDEETFHATIANPDRTHDACVAINDYLTNLLQGRLHRSPLAGIVLVHLGLTTIHDTIRNMPLKWVLNHLTKMITNIWGLDQVAGAVEEGLEELAERLSPRRDPIENPFELPSIGPRPKKDMVH